MNRPIVIVTNSRDYAADLVIAQLRDRDAEYLRLDLDLLREDHVALDPVAPLLTYALRGQDRRVIESPRSVLYRAPTHLRESSGHRYSPEQLLQKHQWTAFARSLAVFQEAKWVNHPTATYTAENKPFQLALASALGFSVPATAVANYVPSTVAHDRVLAVKSLDSFLLRSGDADLFFYTTSISADAIAPEELGDMPVILQDFLADKIDMRVTVVGNRCFPAETTEKVFGDWRVQKDRLRFQRAECPPAVMDMCIALVRRMGLCYGAIDLARDGDSFWFLEINPTGEWAWLEDIFEDEIARALADELLNHEDPQRI